MTRHERLRQICNEQSPGAFSLETPITQMLEYTAIALFLDGVAAWYDDEALLVRDALIELYDTGSLSEYEHPTSDKRGDSGTTV